MGSRIPPRLASDGEWPPHVRSMTGTTASLPRPRGRRSTHPQHEEIFPMRPPTEVSSASTRQRTLGDDRTRRGRQVVMNGLLVWCNCDVSLEFPILALIPGLGNVAWR